MAKRWSLVGIILLVSGCAPETSTTPTSSLAIVQDLEQREHRLFEDASGPIVAMVFLGQDCPIANAYSPELNRLYDDYRNRGVQWLLIDVDPQSTLEAAREHVREYQLEAPMILDPKHQWVTEVGATRTPEAAVFSPRRELLYRGRIDDRYVDFGQRRPEVKIHDLRDALDAILAGKPIAQPRTEAIGCDIPKE